MPIFMRIDMDKPDAYLVKERLTLFFETLNQRKAQVKDEVFEKLGFTIEKFNLGKIKAKKTIDEIDALLEKALGEKVFLDV